MDNKLNWKDHITKKLKEKDLRHKDIYWQLGRTSHLSVDNKLLLYKSVITPIWTYVLEFWGCACNSSIAIIQRCESKILTATVDVPRYVTNYMIVTDLGIPTVHDVIHGRSIKHRIKLESHYSKTFHERTSHEDRKDGGQLTCNTADEISSLERTLSRQ